MRFALHNPYVQPVKAEVESAARFVRAAAALGDEVLVAHRAPEIRAFEPDCVLLLSHHVPKLTEFPTFGLLTAPPAFFEAAGRLVRNLLSCDGLLRLPGQPTEWMTPYFEVAGKPKREVDFAFTCYRTPFVPPALSSPTLAYLGTNWDGGRLGDVFARLAGRVRLRVFGPTGRWTALPEGVRMGTVPFDGRSVLDCYRQAGVGLCLHRQDFIAAGVVSNRLFETVASGAVALCDRVAFVERYFGDSVLYVDTDLPDEAVAEQISGHMAWISSHPGAAAEMARRAHAIFDEHLSLEVMIERLKQWLGGRDRPARPGPSPLDRVEVVHAGATVAEVMQCAREFVYVGDARRNGHPEGLSELVAAADAAGPGTDGVQGGWLDVLGDAGGRVAAWPSTEDEDFSIGYADDTRLTGLDGFHQEVPGGVARRVPASSLLVRTASLARLSPDGGGKYVDVLAHLPAAWRVRRCWTVIASRHLPSADAVDADYWRPPGPPVRVGNLAPTMAERVAEVLAQAEGVTGPVVVYGAAQLGRLIASAGATAGLDVLGFIDSNPSLHGTAVDGRPCWGPDDLPALNVEAVLIASVSGAGAIEATVGGVLGVRAQTTRVIRCR